MLGGLKHRMRISRAYVRHKVQHTCTPATNLLLATNSVPSGRQGQMAITTASFHPSGGRDPRPDTGCSSCDLDAACPPQHGVQDSACPFQAAYSDQFLI